MMLLLRTFVSEQQPFRPLSKKGGGKPYLPISGTLVAAGRGSDRPVECGCRIPFSTMRWTLRLDTQHFTSLLSLRGAAPT